MWMWLLILIIIVIIGIFCIWNKMPTPEEQYHKRINELRHVQWTLDREPTQDDFPPENLLGESGARERYSLAHMQWTERRAKQVTYTMPINAALKLESLYVREICTRNPKRYRGSEIDKGDFSNMYDSDSSRVYSCWICGGRKSYAKCGGYELCDNCRNQMVIAQKNYTPPKGIDRFYPRLWIRQMIALIDHEDGITSETDLEHEKSLVIAYEIQHIEQERSKLNKQHNQKIMEEQRQKEERDTIAKLAGQLRT